MQIVLKPGGKALIAALVVLVGAGAAVKLRSTKAVAAAAPAAPGKTTTIAADASNWTLTTSKPASGTAKTLANAGLPSSVKEKNALHLDIASVDTIKYWAFQAVHPVPDAIAANRALTVRVWARSKTSTPVYVTFESGQASHTAELSRMLELTPEWKEYELPFQTLQDHTKTPANLCIKAGVAVGEVDIAAIQVSDQGAATAKEGA